MDGARQEVLAALQVLQLTQAAIERRLAAEPALHALRQIDEPSVANELHFSTADGPPELWSRLTARIDQSVPEWRLLVGIKTAIVALQAALEDAPAMLYGDRRGSVELDPSSGHPPLPTSANPAPTPQRRGRSSKGPDDQRSLVARIQSASDAWSAHAAREKNRGEDKPATPPSRQKVPAGRRKRENKSAMGGSGAGQASKTEAQDQLHDGLHRMVALETEVDKLMRGGALHQGEPTDVRARYNSPGRANSVRNDRLLPIDEAEVEIVQLAPAESPRQPDAIGPALASAKPDDPARIIFHQSHFEEATVEIVVLDDRSGDDATSGQG